MKALAHGTSRAAIAQAQGESARAGFWSGFAASGFSVGTKGYGGFAGRTLIMATVSGTVSKATGGKFANGAMTGAFVHMFNAEFDTLGKGIKALWSKKAEIGNNVVEGFKGGANGFNRLKNVDSSKFSQEGEKMFKFLMINVDRNTNVTESINVYDKFDMYNDSTTS